MFSQLLKKYGGAVKSKGMILIIALLIFFSICLRSWQTSQCPVDVDTVPIQIVLAFKDGPVTKFSDADINSTLTGFSTFVTAVTGHLAEKLSQEKLCLNNAESQERSLLQFMPWVINAGPRSIASVPPFSTQSSGVCRITSPWIDLVIERKPVPLVRGVFRYSERQLLVDQAVLVGAHNVPPGVAMPLHYKEFNRYEDEYASSEIRGESTEKPIEERVPPDLLWLFRRAIKDPDYSSAKGSMGKAMRTSTEHYTQIVITLIDRCFESEGADIHYNSILDIDDPALLERYKIVRPINTLPEDGER